MSHEESYIDIRECARRLDLSVRTMRNYIKNPRISLPVYKISKKLLFNWAEVERWMDQFRVRTVDIEEIADEIISDFGKDR